jgi:hypothetical protein
MLNSTDLRHTADLLDALEEATGLKPETHNASQISAGRTLHERGNRELVVDVRYENMHATVTFRGLFDDVGELISSVKKLFEAANAADWPENTEWPSAPPEQGKGGTGI